MARPKLIHVKAIQGQPNTLWIGKSKRYYRTYIDARKDKPAKAYAYNPAVLPPVVPGIVPPIVTPIVPGVVPPIVTPVIPGTVTPGVVPDVIPAVTPGNNTGTSGTLSSNSGGMNKLYFAVLVVVVIIIVYKLIK